MLRVFGLWHCSTLHHTLSSVQNSTFELNAGVQGGALRLEAGASATVVSSTFRTNMAAQGSAMLVPDGASCDQVIGCHFINNTQLVDYAAADEVVAIRPIQEHSGAAVATFALRCCKPGPACILHWHSA